MVMIAHTAPSAHSPARPARLVTWLRCRTCHAGYFAAGAPGPQTCPACEGGCLRPVEAWDLRWDPAPAAMLWLAGNVQVHGRAA